MTRLILQPLVGVLFCLNAVVGNGKHYEVTRRPTKDKYSYPNMEKCKSNSKSMIEDNKLYCICDTGTGTFYSKNEKKLGCYNDESIKENGQAITTLNRVEDNFILCSKAIIKYIDFWNYEKENDGFMSFQGKDFEKALQVENAQLKVIKRSRWDGLLIRFDVKCRNRNKSGKYLVKFSGERTYPLPTNINEMINAKPKRNVTGSGSGSKLVVIVIGVSLGVLMVFVIVLLVLWRRKKICKKSQEDAQASESPQGQSERIYTETSHTYKNDRNKELVDQENNSAMELNPSNSQVRSEQPVYHELEKYQSPDLTSYKKNFSPNQLEDNPEALYHRPSDEAQEPLVSNEDTNYYSTAISEPSGQPTAEYAQVHKKKENTGQILYQRPSDETQEPLVSSEDTNYYSTAISEPSGQPTAEYAQVHKKNANQDSVRK